MSVNGCNSCLEKQREIDRLRDDVRLLRDRLRYRKRARSGEFFGSSTPSAKLPVKANTPEAVPKRPKGGQVGHRGVGRKRTKAEEADRVVRIEAHEEQCPKCGGTLRKLDQKERSVIESEVLKARRYLYLLEREECEDCGKVVTPRVPGVFPRELYGNQLITNAVAMHYLHGVPLGRVCEQIGIGDGSLVGIFHRLARLFRAVPAKLIAEYRRAPVKHADETGWRTNGKNGYAWLFATPDLSIFQFLKTRSGKVAREVFGPKRLPGVLLVDRYSGYNRAPCAIQYCYSHLLREVKDLGKEFPEDQEVLVFVNTVAPLLALAMGLRSQDISDKRFHREAVRVQKDIKAAMAAPAKHLGIRRIQDIFTDNKKRLYHWAKNRVVPAENNLAERDLRPTVIARKTSFGSHSDAGAETRGILMTVLATLKKRKVDVAAHLKSVLDQLASDPSLDPCRLLFSQGHPPPK